MRVALTVWENRISPVFDVSREALIAEISGKKIIGKEREDITPHSALSKIDWLVDRNVDTLICGAVSESMMRELQFRNLTVYGFIAGAVDEILTAALNDSLHEDRFLMPGCTGNGRRKRHRRGRNKVEE